MAERCVRFACCAGAAKAAASGAEGEDARKKSSAWDGDKSIRRKKMISFSSLEELACIKDSDALLEKIEVIDQSVQNLGGKAEMWFFNLGEEENTLTFNLSVVFPFEKRTKSKIQFSSLEELARLKDSDALLQKIEELKQSIHNLGCKMKINDFHLITLKGDLLELNYVLSVSLSACQSTEQF